jgi:hypothetical protein
LREKDVDPRMFIGSLVHSCGWMQAAKAMSPHEAIGLFNPHTLARDPWIIERKWLEELGRASGG